MLLENFIDPNALSTPTNIKPEWYFLPFYAILRSIKSKIGGIVVVVLVIVLFWVPTPTWYTGFEGIMRRLFFWVFWVLLSQQVGDYFYYVVYTK
ncbi:unnamed protein product [Protopolystoma xenopodis]|uniref:Cytochrome b/b6 C-terminal region profile domain-containing protein n=1 Tax=Protopolystoma xenopodis TaxID=117903 RepID=A0A3S4ZRY2_9PLAT|nr:unnamed protein product [Protopolystoma xenopodis]